MGRTGLPMIAMMLLAATETHAGGAVPRNFGAPHDGGARQDPSPSPGPAPNDDAGSKRLVLFAGPHASAAAAVEAFFFRLAAAESGEADGSASALRGWVWPRVEAVDATGTVAEGEEPYEIFKHLVTPATKRGVEYEEEANAEAKGDPGKAADLQDVLWTAIDRAWESATTGPIMGTEAFDRGADGIEAMKRVAEHLQVDPLEVTVVINYRTPRLDHWLSIFWEDSAETAASSYEDWLCNSKQYGRKIRLLATEMNPLQLATNVLEVGWKVSIMDLGGIQKMGGDVRQIIACDVLGAQCSNKVGVPWLNGPIEEVDRDVDGNLTLATVATGLSKSNLVMIEELFRIRDCDLQRGLTERAGDQSDSSLELHFPTWSGAEDCSVEWSREMIQNPEIIFQALLSQMECRDDPYQFKHMVTIDQVLGAKEVGASAPAESWGNVLLELIVYTTVLVSSLLYQVYRMYGSRGPTTRQRQSQFLGTDSDHRSKETAILEAEMTQLTASATDLDAEYGIVDDEDDDKVDGIATKNQSPSELKVLSSRNNYV